MTLSEIQKAIESLPEDEQVRLAAWMASRDRAAWDAELERDFSAGGPGSCLLDEVRRQIRAGNPDRFTG
ncbi:MAG TPA: hypothetical protein VL240_08150 [Candidatus Binatia bacterium]|nr:hypothetical protein [Candidatus Binatia bacterium]